MARKSRVGAIAAQARLVRDYVQEHPDTEEDVILDDLNMTRNTLYHYLTGLSGAEDICCDGQFRILKGGCRVDLKEITGWLSKNRRTPGGCPGQSERLLYLYHHLHNAIPDGGLTITQMEDYYIDLIEQSGGTPASEQALRRMIYRDLKALEEIGIALDRPATGSKKYCLRARYLPKLAPESAATVYISMLLFRNTVLDEATSRAKTELEKAFFKKPLRNPGILRDRIHIVSDTLAHPEQFGDKFGKIIRSVAFSFRVKIVYAKLTGEISERVLEPVGMVCKRNVWYLVARLPDNNEYRTFRVDQIEDIYPRENETFVYPEGFSVSDYVGASWGVFRNDSVQTVLLRFSPEVASRIKNLRHHWTQEVLEEDVDGSVVVKFEVCGLVELKSWLLQWGTNVEVLEPPQLRKEMAEAALAIASLYRYEK